ncbi:ubiquitin-conjugating enzyme E2 I [Nematocida sp. AWRm78]|nr:ubiquitin-conjugating enzyme E2 I [Nematocida sp. AWRm79]KAI5183470.1 ubiquitin-conjugating enzyme E2 I [Nematocida sp. AWRm78]
MNSEQRILQERENWRKDRPFGFVAKPQMRKDKTLDLFNWICTIPGPEGSPFFGQDLSLKIEFLSSYPTSPPVVKFVQNVFHPNVYNDGYICLDLLDHAWSPSLNIKTILLAVQTLLAEPNIDSPANVKAANLYTQKPGEYNSIAIKRLSVKRKASQIGQ